MISRQYRTIEACGIALTFVIGMISEVFLFIWTK